MAQTTTATYGPATGGAIPDNTATGLSSSITVSGTTNVVTSINSVTITGLTHTWAGDLVATLTHGATAVRLFNRPGGASESTDFGGAYTFSIGGTNLATALGGLGATAILPSGTYAPTDNYSAFNGLSMAGDWILNIADLAALDTGTYTSWQFNATSTPPPPPPVYNNGPGSPIADATFNILTNTTTPSTTTSDIVVTDNFTIGSLSGVTIRGLDHSLAGDLRAQLQHVGTGTTVDLFNRPGRITNDPFDFGDDSDLFGAYTFDLNGANFVDAAAAGNTSYIIPTGSYAASTSPVAGQTNLNTLSSFNGENVNGAWRLIFTDYSAGDVGSFTGWGFSAFAAVPEPSSLPLMAIGGLLLSLTAYRQWRRKTTITA